jgi:hypothetical protein
MIAQAAAPGYRSVVLSYWRRGGPSSGSRNKQTHILMMSSVQEDTKCASLSSRGLLVELKNE